MTNNYGFTFLKEETITELKTKAALWRHNKTGAELLSMVNDDENKVFGITFRTPPENSTGVAHIMEHSVLCGSRKYPLKEPFVELVKGSLQTFLNAFTYPDRTCYPLASQNLQDFYNLIDVYLDAVFYPNLTHQIFQQEGWHYELENLADPLTFKGVVFNEMKGVYSSPDGILGRYIQTALFPDNSYGVDSGGNPEQIPDLSYDYFQKFHKTYYHPSNARIFFYGDDDPSARLRLMADYLDSFEQIKVDSTVALQPLIDQPRRINHTYAISKEEKENGKGYLTVNWLLPEIVDMNRYMSLSLLSYILGSSAAQMYKALIDSGLGEAVTGVSFTSHLRQVYFSAGLKGVALEDIDKVEPLILQILTDLAENGIDKEIIEAAVNIIEFRLRENNTGSYPRGLSLMLTALRFWIYDKDPFAPLSFETPLAVVKDRIKNNPTYFEDIIKKYLLENNHRVTISMTPDPDLSQRKEFAETERLAQARAGMNETDLQTIIEETSQLKLKQETADSPEALASIPTLTLSDLDKQNKIIPLSISEEGGNKLLYHDLFTNGLIYLDVGFNMHLLPQELLPYVRLFGSSLLQLGTETEDYVKLSRRIDSKTGGVWPSFFISPLRDAEGSTAWMMLRSKATMSQADDMLAVLRDVLLTVKLDNQERFRQLVLISKAGAEAGLAQAGSAVANARLLANFTEAAWVNEQMGGVSNLFFLRRLAEQVENDWPSVLAKLEQIRSLLLNKQDMFCNITLDEANWQQFRPKLAAFMNDLPSTPLNRSVWTPQPFPIYEGLTMPSQVNYVAKGGNLYQVGYKLHGSVSVITNYLRTAWLWDMVRVQGGAYGGSCSFGYNSGIFSYVSYRDPNLINTLDIYDRTGQFLANLELSKKELTRTIIGAIGSIDSYQLPDAKGYSSMVRYLTGVTDEKRQRMRDEILGATLSDFKQFAGMLETIKEGGRVVVLGSEAAVEAANNGSRGKWLETLKVL